MASGLNRWQRIGIALSVAWAIGAYSTVTKIRYDRAALEVAVTRGLCAQAKAQSKDLDCTKEEERTWNNWTDNTAIYAIVIAIFPIPFGWAFADFVIWAVGRIRKSSDPSV
jgi:hypothetical protein